MSERRLDPRLSGFSLPVTQATLRPGTAVHLVDLSEGGTQIQTDRPLRPGGRAFLRLETISEPVGLAALVLRCVVWAIHPMGGVSYRAALRFEARCPRFWERIVFRRDGLAADD